MDPGTLGMDTGTAQDPTVKSDCKIAYMRRRAWAQSRDSIWPEAEPEDCGSQKPQRQQEDGKVQGPSEESGREPNEVTNWLIECRTPLGASLDDQSASPNRGAVRNGCSFEDDLSLGAEANHLHSSNNKTESCFGLAADQKRSRFKEGARSMNSTGSGKSSTVSSVTKVLEESEEQPEAVLLNLRVSELLDLYEEDPEEILLNLGFGREEPDPSSRVPSRFINSASSARGIDIKVYLGAQLQRMELENPNYALTSRFRQIEVLTSVANEFFQLYSQVSGQPVQRISKEQGEGGEEGGDEQSPALKRKSSALNVAKLLKKTISKHNLFVAASESHETNVPNQHTELNGHASSVHTNASSQAQTSVEMDECSTDPDPQTESANQKHVRKKDSCSLATVTEETSGDGETDESSDQISTNPVINGGHQVELGDPQSKGTDKRIQVVKEETEEEEEEEKKLTSTPERVPPTLAPLQLPQLRTKNTDSFDMEEIQSNEDEALPHRTSRTTDLLRTVSQQSDSSGFAEEPSVDFNSYLKVQESSDSCDSETTVTSHPSQDVVTPLALDHPAFDLPDHIEKEAVLGGAAEDHGRSSSLGENEHDQSSEQVPHYTAHQLPMNRPMELQESQDEEQIKSENRTHAEPEQQITQNLSAVDQELHTQNQPTLQQDPQLTQHLPESNTDTELPTEVVNAEDGASLDDSGSLYPPASSSPVLCALKRAQQNQLSRLGQWDAAAFPGRGRGRGRRGIPLQRSSSLPSSLISASRVVSSVRIQFGRGRTSCSQPRYSFRYSHEPGGEKEAEEEETEGQTSSLSTLVINPPSSSGTNNQPKLPMEAPVQTKSIPRPMMRSSCSLQSSSPPPDLSLMGHSQSWTTQSFPDLSSIQQPVGPFQQNTSTNRIQQNLNYRQMMFRNPNPTPPYLSPSPSPSLSHNPYPMLQNPPLQYPSPLQPYASLPNLFHYNNPSLVQHSSQTSLHQPIIPTLPQHSNHANLHQPSAPPPVGNPHLGTPTVHQQGYNHFYSPQLSYHSAPHGSQCASPYLGFHGYSMNPNLALPHPVTQYSPLVPEHNLHQGLVPPVPGFIPGLTPTHSPGPGLYPGHTPSPPLTSTEVQLRKVLHDIRGTVQTLGQSRTDTLDTFNDHKANLPSYQPLAEFQQKRRSLNVFRSQMMDLEMSIMQQQALVYRHLSPAERLEVEQLQSLRSAVRQELQELEQQLEDRLMEMTHQSKYRAFHRDSCVDSLSSASALRAIEPVSDLLREQFILQSEISYDGRASSSRRSSLSSSMVREEGGDGEHRPSTFRASINITPAPPPRPKMHTEEEEEEEEEEKDGEGVKIPEVEGAVGNIKGENLEQLIRQIRESMAQEIRKEIYSELLATVSPLPSKQHPL